MTGHSGRKQWRFAGWRRVHHKYRLVFEDDARLERVWSVRVSYVRIVIAVVLLLAVGVGIGVLIVGFTPVKRQMPGYMTGEDRASALHAIMSIDSLQKAAMLNQAFMDNIAMVMDTDRESMDSVNAVKRPQNNLSLDSLIGSSARERKFVAMMEESERYNLKVLSPLAAEGIIWADPVPGAVVFEQSRTLPMLRLIAPRSQGVSAMADGRVIEREYDAGTLTYSLMVQHSKGFVSRYSSLGTPLVDKGELVLAGQLLSRPGRSKTVGVEMWRDGTPLIPAEYVDRKAAREAAPPMEAPRGR